MTARHRLRSLLTLVQLNGIIPIRTQPLYVLNLLASPLSFLFFIYIVSRGALLEYGVLGGMILTMLSVGTSLQSDLTHYRHDLKFQDVVVASPVEAPVYVAGMALSEFVYSLPAVAVFAVIFVLEGWANPYTVAVLVGVVVLVWAFASALAFTLATYFQDVRETFLFSPLISLGLTVIPPVYYPLSDLPGWAQTAALFSPTTYAAELVQGSVGLISLPVDLVVRAWIVLLAFVVGLLVLASVKAHWQEP